VERDQLTERIIGAAIEVHRELGPGLLESAYESCLSHELARCNLGFTRQVPVPIKHKGHKIDIAYRIDVVVESRVVLEVKAVEALTPVHTAQLMTYMRLSKMRTGLLLNFNVRMMRDGIKRFVL
jgi:GxxExxY protein